MNAITVIETRDCRIAGDLTARYERAIYNIATHITEGQYQGGNWELKVLENGGWFMAYTGDEVFECHNAANYFTGSLQGDAFSVVVNMYVSSHLSFYFYERESADMCEAMSNNYHYLRDYAFQDDSPFSSEEISTMLNVLD